VQSCSQCARPDVLRRHCHCLDGVARASARYGHAGTTINSGHPRVFKKKKKAKSPRRRAVQTSCTEVTCVQETQLDSWYVRALGGGVSNNRVFLFLRICSGLALYITSQTGGQVIALSTSMDDCTPSPFLTGLWAAFLFYKTFCLQSSSRRSAASHSYSMPSLQRWSCTRSWTESTFSGRSLSLPAPS